MHRMWFAAAVAALAGCPGDGTPTCSEVVVDCVAQYEPTFENVYTRTLEPGCGARNSACHSAAGKKGGLSFEDMQTAFSGLRSGRVVPNDPSCSEVIVRTSTIGESYTMPPGSSLSPEVRCSLIKWVEMGAPGPASAVQEDP
jgi:hypothetical protein